MSQAPDGKPAKTERVTFTRPAAERIAKAVRKVEQGDRDCVGLTFDRVPSRSLLPLKLATFTGNWQTGTYKTVTLSGSTATASVYNWCNPALGGDDANTTKSRYVIFGKVQGTQSAVEIQSSEPQAFRVATFTGDWPIGSAKVVTFRNQTTTPNTASATNLFWPIPDGSQRDCSIAKDGTAWYLLVPRLYAAEAVTAATLTTSALEFNTLPVVALTTAGTNKFTITPVAVEPITDVTLNSDGLVFTRKSVGVFFDQTAGTVSISVTTCSTAAT